MKFSTRQDIEAPVGFVFDQATDFDGFETQALRRGVEVVRLDGPAGTGAGLRWDASFRFRGKPRRIDAELSRFEAPNGYQIHSLSGGIEADLTVDFMALSPNKTRVIVGLDLRPRTLSARLMIQSLKFAKANLYSRFENRIARFAKDIEMQYGAGRGIRI